MPNQKSEMRTEQELGVVVVELSVEEANAAEGLRALLPEGYPSDDQARSVYLDAIHRAAVALEGSSDRQRVADHLLHTFYYSPGSAAVEAYFQRFPGALEQAKMDDGEQSTEGAVSALSKERP